MMPLYFVTYPHPYFFPHKNVNLKPPRNTTFLENWSQFSQWLEKAHFLMIRLKRWWSYRSSYATKPQNRKPQNKACHHCTDNTSNTKRQKHSTQLDIAVRERAYFLWGSSPCLEWRVYTHNASPARRGGSPGQNAPPLWSPGSTGPGLLWCRTGKRRSPCYLQVEGGRQAQTWIKYSWLCTRQTKEVC